MRKICCLIALLYTISVQAQLSFQFIPELHGRNPDGLFQVTVLNSTGSPLPNTRLVMRVTAKGVGEVLRVQVPNVTLQTGINRLLPSHTTNAQVQFGGHTLARMVKQGNYFPEGEYEYCFILEEGNKPSGLGAELARECFPYTVEALSPVSLIDPFNKQVLCHKMPTLTWQPVLPAINGLQYQLTLAEVKEKQTPVEAFYYNIPLVNARGLINTYLPYPAYSKPLDTGKTYVWQVTAYKADLILSRSEVWTFRIGCDEEKKAEPNEGYRNIEDLALGNFYLAKGSVKFALYNPYAETKLTYSVQCLNEPGRKIRRLPEVILRKGSNLVRIDLEDNSAFKDGDTYLMKVQLPGGVEKQLRFIYKAD